MGETTPEDRSECIRLPYLEYALFALLALGIVYQLFTEPIVGLASNGDYWRITEQVGLYYDEHPEDENAHLVRTYQLDEPDNWARYRSSELLLVHTALTVNRMFSGDQLFDIRLLGAVHSALFLLGAGLILWAMRHFGLLPRILVGGLLLLIFTDVAYVSYFNSFYSEPASLIFLVLTTGLGLTLITRDRSQPQHTIYVVLFFLAAALLVTAKPQNGAIGIPLALIGYRLSGVSLIPSWDDYKRHLVAGALALLLIVISLGYPFLGQPEAFREANLYNAVFNELLRTSDAPEEDLRALDLNPELTEFAGTHAYEPAGFASEPEAHPLFFDHVGYGALAWFYVQNPARAIDLASRGAEHISTMRPDYLGNFEASAGHPPRAQSQSFATWSNSKSDVLPNSLTFLTLFFGASLAASVLIHWWSRGHRPLQLTAEFHAALVVMASLQFMIVLFGEGEYEITKHLFFYHALFDMSLVFLALVVASAVTVIWRR